MKRYEIQDEGISLWFGYSYRVLQGSLRSCGLPRFLSRMRLPYLAKIERYDFPVGFFRVYLRELADQDDRQEFRNIVDGYMTGTRVIPRHFKKLRHFLPHETKRPLASWHYE